MKKQWPDVCQKKKNLCDEDGISPKYRTYWESRGKVTWF